jgi:D-alanyl-D-alanine carboxypeptidase
VRQALTWTAGRSAFGQKVLLPFLIAASFVLGNVAQAAANPKYAAIVIDANTGRTLYESNADAPRYPASLTKMMTLYMVFEAMANGKISKSTRVPFSKNAAAEPPTKLGIKAGGSVTVEDAIYALVTKSANDVSTAVAEFLGGSEARFAQMMTSKARALGMKSTTFRNAHGLPNDGQRTTARDMAKLGIALREHYPQYYSYFSTRSVTVAGGIRLSSHNRLLGRIKGVDGIKTGYIRASGFNLVSSVRSGDRSLVAVVMGGKSARSRDDHMAALISEYLPKASTRGGGALIASKKTIAPTQIVAAGAAGIVLPSKDIPTPDSRPTDSIAAYAAAEPAKAAIAAASAVTAKVVPTARPQAEIELEETGEGDIDLGASTIPSGWVIQVASVGSEAEARDVLARTSKNAGQVLADATPFTEPFTKGGTSYVRVRFAGFASKNEAWNACGALKKKNIACYAVQQ